MNSKKTLFLLAAILIMSFAQAQNVPTAFSKRDSAFFSKTYPYILPILGDKVHRAKIRLPYPMGVMFNTLVGRQNLSLSDMALGFGRYSDPAPPNMIDVSDIIAFDDITAQTSTFNMRIDAWLLPFVNVYGIVGQTKKADISVNLAKPFPLEVTTEVSGTYVGYGVMAAGAVGPMFISLDVNRTYNYNPRLDDPAKVLIGGLRTGPVFRFKNNPDMNITLWAGAMYSHFNGETDGTIGAFELAPDAPADIEDKQNNLHNWYNGLTPVEQALYKNIYEKLDNGLTQLKEGVEDGYIRYSFNKKISNPWNVLTGAQWQINYRWQLRAEAQFLGDRTAGLFSLNYRFGIKGKNWFSN
jgi:hypothetical protein